MEIPDLKIGVKDLYLKMAENPYFLSILSRDIDGKIKVLNKINHKKILFLKKTFVNISGIESISGYVLIQFVDEICNIDILKDFREHLEEMVHNYGNDDYFEIDPVIVAKGFERDVVSFINKYNEFQSRSPIRLYKGD